MQIATGTYTGDGTDNRQIAVGFKCSAVMCFGEYNSVCVWMIPNRTINEAGAIKTGGTGLHAIDGFTVYQTGDNMNEGAPARVWYYWAISE